MNKFGFLGIDISKGYADLYAVRSDKQPLESTFRLYDVPEGHQQLGKLIDGWLATHQFETFYCGVESTGGYENNWVNYLQQLCEHKPLRIARLNAKGVKALSDAALKRTITDSVSAENIAMYLIDFRHKIHWMDHTQTAKVYSDGRRHNSFIRMLKKQRIQLSNQLEKLVYQELSPMMCYCRHGLPGWMLLLLERYPSIAAIKKAGMKGICKIKGVSEAKATAILKKVEGIDGKTSTHISAVMKSTIQQILLVDKSIATEKARLITRFKDTADVKLLTTVSGLGDQSAVEMLIEIEDIARFDSAKKLCAYFGLHPVFKQSGDGKWGNHMSKKGRSEIRAVLFMSSLTAVRYNELFKSIYSRARAKGKNHFNAMGVVMHKLLRIVYGVLKNKLPFNTATDQGNQEKAKAKQSEKETASKQVKKEQTVRLERYNEVETANTPISKRHAKKLKVAESTVIASIIPDNGRNIS